MKIAELFPLYDIDKLRLRYEGNCVSLAVDFAQELRRQRYGASYVTFKNGTGFAKDGVLHVWSDIHGKCMKYTHHSVIVYDKFVIDILHYDEPVRMAEYMRKLKELNSKLTIEERLTGTVGSAGHVASVITLDMLFSESVW